MGFVEEALLLIKAGDHRTAAKILTEHVDDPDLKKVARINVMEWIGESYSKCDEKGDAAIWYEKAGNAILETKEMASFERKKKALQDFERAMDCYKSENDKDGIRRVSVLKYSLSNPSI